MDKLTFFMDKTPIANKNILILSKKSERVLRDFCVYSGKAGVFLCLYYFEKAFYHYIIVGVLEFGISYELEKLVCRNEFCIHYLAFLQNKVGQFYFASEKVDVIKAIVAMRFTDVEFFEFRNVETELLLRLTNCGRKRVLSRKDCTAGYVPNAREILLLERASLYEKFSVGGKDVGVDTQKPIALGVMTSFNRKAFFIAVKIVNVKIFHMILVKQCVGKTKAVAFATAFGVSDDLSSRAASS